MAGSILATGVEGPSTTGILVGKMGRCKGRKRKRNIEKPKELQNNLIITTKRGRLKFRIGVRGAKPGARAL